MAGRDVMLPKIINFIWLGKNKLPDWAEKNIAEFKRLNPNYEIMLHGEEVLLPELQNKYEQIWDVTSKSDLLRISALKQFGGWYFDTDCRPLRPIDDIVNAYGLTGEKLFLSQQGCAKKVDLTNFVLAAGKDCKTLDRIIAYIIDRPALCQCAFGPEMMNYLVPEYPDEFVVADWIEFSPLNIISPGGQNPFVLHGSCTVKDNKYNKLKGLFVNLKI